MDLMDEMRLAFRVQSLRGFPSMPDQGRGGQLSGANWAMSLTPLDQARMADALDRGASGGILGVSPTGPDERELSNRFLRDLDARQAAEAATWAAEAKARARAIADRQAWDDRVNAEADRRIAALEGKAR